MNAALMSLELRWSCMNEAFMSYEWATPGSGRDITSHESLSAAHGHQDLAENRTLPGPKSTTADPNVRQSLVLVWLYALVLPRLGTALPPELHAMVTDGYATIGIALAITWRTLDKKR